MISILRDMLGGLTQGEMELRSKLADAQKHADELEEALLRPDPEEFTNPRRHVEICFARQLAAHAHRKAASLQSQLNGAENRRYSRANLGWMLVCFGAVMLKGVTLPPSVFAMLEAFVRL